MVRFLALCLMLSQIFNDFIHQCKMPAHFPPSIGGGRGPCTLLPPQTPPSSEIKW